MTNSPETALSPLGTWVLLAGNARGRAASARWEARSCKGDSSCKLLSHALVGRARRLCRRPSGLGGGRHHAGVDGVAHRFSLVLDEASSMVVSSSREVAPEGSSCVGTCLRGRVWNSMIVLCETVGTVVCDAVRETVGDVLYEAVYDAVGERDVARDAVNDAVRDAMNRTVEVHQ